MTMQDDRRVDELRQRLRSLGYLDAGVDRFVLASTSGPVEHVKTWCLDGHGFTQRADALTGWPMVRVPKPAGTGG